MPIVSGSTGCSQQAAGSRTIQVYTIARGPAESFVTPLSDVELDQIAGLVRSRVAVPVDVHYGVVPDETAAAASVMRLSKSVVLSAGPAFSRWKS